MRPFSAFLSVLGVAWFLADIEANADDMGFSAIGCFGSEITTANLDRLADNGRRFSHFYNTGRCGPSRASLLTGLYPHQADIGHMAGDIGVRGYRDGLSFEAVTLAEARGAAGHHAIMTGKRLLVGSRNGPWELYDPAKDRTELNTSPRPIRRSSTPSTRKGTPGPKRFTSSLRRSLKKPGTRSAPKPRSAEGAPLIG